MGKGRGRHGVWPGPGLARRLRWLRGGDWGPPAREGQQPRPLGGAAPRADVLPARREAEHAHARGAGPGGRLAPDARPPGEQGAPRNAHVASESTRPASQGRVKTVRPSRLAHAGAHLDLCFGHPGVATSDPASSLCGLRAEPPLRTPQGAGPGRPAGPIGSTNLLDTGRPTDPASLPGSGLTLLRALILL